MTGTDDEPPTLMGLLANRVRMTEGQLYTVVLVALGVLLLSVLGLANAGEPPDPSIPSPAATAQESP